MINDAYKDRLFSFIFGNKGKKEWTLSLYNAINHSNYTDINEIEITTMEDVLYMSMKNDVSFILDNVMSLYEQQSTYNPNMPLRGLMYLGRLYGKYVREHNYNLYGSRVIPLPIPKLITFYNGQSAQNDTILELDSAFQEMLKQSGKEKESIAQADISVSVRMININYGKNQELMAACQPLQGYAWLIAEIRANSAHMSIEDAVNKALDDMPDEFVIKDLLMNNRAEVTEMCITEYNEAQTMEQFKEEGIAIGMAQGMEKGLKRGMAQGIEKGMEKGKLEALIHIIEALNLSLDKAMDAIGIKAEEKEQYAALVRSARQP